MVARYLLGTALGALAAGLFGLLCGAFQMVLSAANWACRASVLSFTTAGALAGLLMGLAAALYRGEGIVAGGGQLRDGAVRGPGVGYRFARPVVVIRLVRIEPFPGGSGGPHTPGPSLN
jgi:hypothetical protein